MPSSVQHFLYQVLLVMAVGGNSSNVSVDVSHRHRNHKISGGANDIMSQNIILNYLSCHSIINEYVNNYTSSLYKIVRLRYIIWGGQSHNK